MAAFRSLAASDVVEVLAAFGPPAAASPGFYVGHQAIAVGTINTNVRVETAAGPRFLRINEGKTADDVAREAAIVEHLADRGVPTPVPLAAPSGERFVPWRGQLVSLFPWVPGRTLSRAEVTEGHARQVGRALAALHVAGVSFPDHRAGRYEPPEIHRRLAAIATSAARADAALGAAVAVLEPELAALASERAAEIPAGVIHGDLFIDNVLYDGDRLTAFIDFEQASWGRLGYDLAVTLLAFAFGRDDFRPEIVRGLLDEYLALRAPSAIPVTSAERAAFGAELRFAACRFAVTRITDVHLRRGAGAPPGKDFRRYLARLASIKAHLAANDGLLAM
jgi:homoserine kinase type II